MTSFTTYLHTAAFVIKGRFLLAASSAASLSVDFSLGFPVSVPSLLEAVVSDGTAPSRVKPRSNEEFSKRKKKIVKLSNHLYACTILTNLNETKYKKTVFHSAFRWI